MKQIQTEKWFFALLWVILLVSVIGLRDWNSRFDRPINGDGKGYYAYLPAVFIYHDPQFEFIETIERNYYPPDRSQFKDFLNEQPNGRVVNKTFPGLSLLYAPFFFMAWLIAWIGRFACDGYSLPFQLSIAIAHVVYLMLGLRALYECVRSLGLGGKTSLLLLLLTVFGTNIWYYTVYDHSVGHVFSFFLCCLFSWNLISFFKLKKPWYLSVSLVLVVLMMTIRPTNALMVLFIPFLARLSGEKLLPSLLSYVHSLKSQWFAVPVCVVIVSLLPLVWYWQTGHFVVYSYGKETFDFAHPHFVDFLFSYQKGWLLWSPFIALMLLSTVFIFVRKDRILLAYFLFPLILIIYVLSSWWCWTYGDGFGQRPMIEFIPLIVFVFGSSLVSFGQKARVILLSALIPLAVLSIFQGFQIHEGVMKGGRTDRSTYWSHFVQWYTDAPKATIPPEFSTMYIKQTKGDQLSVEKPYSKAIFLPMKDVSMIKISARIAGVHGDTNVRIVLSSKNATYYKSEFTGMYIYNFERSLSYSFPVEDCKEDTLIAYVWNGDTGSKLSVRMMNVVAYKKMN